MNQSVPSTSVASFGQDAPPWEKVKVPIRDELTGQPIEGVFREVLVAHADLKTMRAGGRDTRWPLGSGINPHQPTAPNTTRAVDAISVGMTGFSTDGYRHRY